MIQIVAPIFAVILAGYLFAKWRVVDRSGTRLLNDYVLFVALPALLFIAVANADPSDLLKWGFIGASLIGIAAAFVCGVLAFRFSGGNYASSVIPGMAASYGTTGYMGVPLLIEVLGEEAIVPAAIATILHNVPVIMTVILAKGFFAQNGESGSSGFASVRSALTAAFTNPLVLAVAAGTIVSAASLPLPSAVDSFARFLGAAAGPTALFALGLGLAQLDSSALFRKGTAAHILPIVGIKVFVQPLVTLGAAYFLFGMSGGDVWLTTAVIMAALPIGAGVFVFASKFREFEQETTVAIILSLILTLATLPMILSHYVG